MPSGSDGDGGDGGGGDGDGGNGNGVGGNGGSNGGDGGDLEKGGDERVYSMSNILYSVHGYHTPWYVVTLP